MWKGYVLKQTQLSYSNVSKNFWDRKSQNKRFHSVHVSPQRLVLLIVPCDFPAKIFKYMTSADLRFRKISGSSGEGQMCQGYKGMNAWPTLQLHQPLPWKPPTHLPFRPLVSVTRSRKPPAKTPSRLGHSCWNRTTAPCASYHLTGPSCSTSALSARLWPPWGQGPWLACSPQSQAWCFIQNSLSITIYWMKGFMIILESSDNAEKSREENRNHLWSHSLKMLTVPILYTSSQASFLSRCH